MSASDNPRIMNMFKRVRAKAASRRTTKCLNLESLRALCHYKRVVSILHSVKVKDRFALAVILMLAMASTIRS